MDVHERWSELVAALAQEPDVDPPGGRGFGARTVRCAGSIAALLAGDRLVLKLPRARVAALLTDGIGEPWDAGKGSPLAEWVALPISADWERLASEALTAARDRRRTSPRGHRRPIDPS